MRITIERITFNFGLSDMIPKEREKKGRKIKIQLRLNHHE